MRFRSKSVVRIECFLTLTLFGIASFLAAGCSSDGGRGATSSIPAIGSHLLGKQRHRIRPADASCCIKHVFVIIQENRSLNNIFAGFPGANTTMTGEMAPGPFSTASPTPVPLHPVALATAVDLEHCYYDASVALNTGLMDGFNWEYLYDSCSNGSQYAGTNPYAYVQRSDVEEYWDIANSWVLAANFYPTELGPSFTAHLNLIAGTTEVENNRALADFPNNEPWGCDAPSGTKTRHLTPTETPGPLGSPFPCLNSFHTIADPLDGQRPAPSGSASPVPWRYYAPAYGQGGYIWSAFDAIKRVRKGTDWSQDVVSPETQILKDIPNGKLDNVGVVWVVPDCKRSDHAGPCGPYGKTYDEGPSWVADVVNEIGTRDKLWDSSVIVVLWDDWGGWYDPAVPVTEDFRGLGIRTPMLILSPYAKEGQDSGHVSLRQFEPGSILKFIEEAFNLPSLGSLQYYYYGGLGYTDQRATSIGKTLDFTQSPRPFGTPIATKYSAYYLENDLPSGDIPDSE